MSLTITKIPFGKVDNKEVSLYTLTNTSGTIMKITNYGGIITEMYVADKNGKFENINLGQNTFEKNVHQNSPYMGALIGRYGNRIKNGKFTLEGVEYTLATNNGPNALHGGLKGFDKVVWDATEISSSDCIGLELTYISKHMEEGYPGTLTTKVKYCLSNNNDFQIYYEATTDKTTIINLTQHAYFNLTGCKESILGHEVKIAADAITAVDEHSIPTGELMKIAGTAFDFTSVHTIGERIEKVGGYDHNYVLNRKGNGLEFAGEAYDPKSGRLMQVFTTEPGMQFYTGNYLDGTITGIDNVVYHKNYGFCFETQHFPDSPNNPSFPTTVLKPGEKYTQTTVYKFSVR